MIFNSIDILFEIFDLCVCFFDDSVLLKPVVQIKETYESVLPMTTPESGSLKSSEGDLRPLLLRMLVGIPSMIEEAFLLFYNYILPS